MQAGGAGRNAPIRSDKLQGTPGQTRHGLQELVHDPAHEYLAGLGVELDVTERHRVFSVSHDGVRYLIPTLLLMKAMFRPFSQLTPFLFAPNGLELMSIPDPRGPEPSVHLMPGVLDTYSRRTASVREPLSWYWSFPTARRCWDSAYAWARQGHLALDLPTGKIRLVIAGSEQ